MVELKEFRRKHGHCKVKRMEEGTKLGAWIYKLRKEYDHLQEGKQVAHLNPERIQELKELGMVWRLRAAKPRKGDARSCLWGKLDRNVLDMDGGSRHCGDEDEDGNTVDNDASSSIGCRW